MTRGKRKTAWLVIVSYVTTLCAGASLHLLPGCGHSEQAASNQIALGASTGGNNALECSREMLAQATSSSHSSHHADDCPICKLGVMSANGGPTAAPVSVGLIVCKVIWRSIPKTFGGASSSFLSRAPPAV